MSDYVVALYSASEKIKWDNFISNSNQPFFLFQRNFMDYHNHRFKDYSLMVYENDELIALLPANRVGENIYSHQGLTYGGLILNNIYNDKVLLAIYFAVLEFVRANSVKSISLKSLPEFYDKTVVFSNRLLKGNLGAEVYQKHKVLAVDYDLPFTIHKTKLKNYRKNKKKGFVIEETNSFDVFWNEVLIPRLKSKHNTKPVHSLTEIKLLNSRFPNQIKQFNIFLDNKILAGITIFDKGRVVKSQYGATTERGEKERALEYLFIHLIYKYKDYGKHFFSMGTVTDTSNKMGYNPGLLKQKEELGCKIYSQDFLLIET